MKRHAPPTAAAFVATAALLMSACGGGDGETASSNSDKGSVAEPVGEASASHTASTADSAVSADRPKIELPSDLTYTFEWPKTGDAGKDAVLSDSEHFIKAVDMAIAKQDPLNEAYLFYSEGEAAAGSEKFIRGFVGYMDRITGAKRYFDAKVNVNSGGTAGLVYCEDQTKAYNKSLETGKTNVTVASKDSYVLYSSRLRVNESGIWITETLTSQRGSSVCQP
ncbi:hypothetical protein [Streptomyces sp. NBC_00280]|uniref:hypothetical protein n=1 Tax=Streptomyces sp. NBC_00280 TaxID=2975699 RepID=UPI0032490EA0